MAHRGLSRVQTDMRLPSIPNRGVQKCARSTKCHKSCVLHPKYPDHLYDVAYTAYGTLKSTFAGNILLMNIIDAMIASGRQQTAQPSPAKTRARPVDHHT
jgi:hypothetical protein